MQLFLKKNCVTHKPKYVSKPFQSSVHVFIDLEFYAVRDFEIYSLNIL